MYEEEATKEKMCEKISQLTRVIYLLHSKNIDAQSSIESILSSYDEEITNIVQEANNAIAVLKARISHLSAEERYEERCNAMYDQIAGQCQLAMADKADKLNEAFKLKEEAMQKEYNDKVEAMKEEVKETKRALVLFKERVSIAQQNEYNKAIDDIKNESHKQIEAFLIEYEDRKTQREAIINELTERNKDLEQLNKDSSARLATIEAECRKVLSELKEKDGIITQLTKDSLMKDNKLLAIECEYKKKLNDLAQELSDNSKVSNQQKGERDKYKAKGIELEIDLKETKSLLHKAELSYESLKIDKESSDEKLTQATSQFALIEQSLNEAKELYVNELKENESLTKDNSNLQKQLASLEEKVKQIEESTKAQISSLMLKLKESEEKWKKKLLTINEMKGTHQSEINQLKFSFQTTIDEMKRVKTASDSSSQEVQRLKALLNEEKALMESKHREDMDRANFRHTLAMNEMKTKHSEEMISIKQENAKLKDKLGNYDKEMKKKQEEFKLSQIEHFQKMKHDFMDALNIQQEKNYNLTNEINDLENYLTNRPSREEDIAEICKLREELSAKNEELQHYKGFIQPGKGETEGKEENGFNLQGKGLKKIKILQSNARETPNSVANSKNPSASTMKNQKYTNANYGMIFSKNK